MNRQCDCRVCKILRRFDEIRAKLPEDDASYLTTFLESWMEEGMDLNYHQAVADGSWPTAVETLKGWLDRAEKKKAEEQ